MLAADPNQCAQQIAECKASLAKLDIANKPVLQHALDGYGRGDAPCGLKTIMQLVQATFHQYPKQAATFKAECKLIEPYL